MDVRGVQWSAVVLWGLAFGCSGGEPGTETDGASDASTSSESTSSESTSSESTSSEGTSSETTVGETGIDESSSSSTTSPRGVGYASEVQPIWEGNCTCHLQGPSGMMAAPFMTLNPGVAYDELVNAPAEQADMVRVMPMIPEQSYVWQKLNGTHRSVGGSGDSMPPGVTLDPEELEIIEVWILEGAAP